MPYATDEQLKLAEELGYDHERSQRTGDHFSKHENGVERRVWLYIGRAPAAIVRWQTADIVKGYYTNHLPYTHLESALQRDIGGT